MRMPMAAMDVQASGAFQSSSTRANAVVRPSPSRMRSIAAASMMPVAGQLSEK
jgi:hypothetical protein